MSNDKIKREGRQVVRFAANGRRIVINTLPTAFEAALYRNAIIRTDFGRLGPVRRG
jgi:hypothetical protein